MHSILNSPRYKHSLIITLRFTLALVFVWFGFLKIWGFNPVFDLIYNSMMPAFAEGPGLIILGLIELGLGLMLCINKARTVTHTFLVLHLLGTFSTFIYGWHVVFVPHFPILSLSGEFVIKNIVLAIAALVVLTHER